MKERTFKFLGDHEVPFDAADRTPVMLKDARLRALWQDHRWGHHRLATVRGCPPCKAREEEGLAPELS